MPQGAPPRMAQGHVAPGAAEDATLRRRIIWGIVGLSAFLCGGSVFGGCVLVERIVDYRPAAAQLPEAARAYRAAGLPWVAADLAPQPPVRPEENAAPLIREAAKRTAAGKWNQNEKELREAALAGEWATVDRTLKEYGPTLAIFEQAAKRPRADFGRDLDLGPNVLYPEYAGIRAGVRALGYRARLRAARGEQAGARSDIRTAWALAGLAESDGNLLSLLVRIACETITEESAQRVAATDLRLAAPLIQELSRPRPEPDFARALRGEAYLSVATARNLHGRLSRTDLEELSDGDSVQGVERDPARLVREGIPDGLTQRAYMARSLQAWTRAAEAMRRHGDDPIALGKALDRIAEVDETKKALSYVLNIVMLPVFAPAGGAVGRSRAGREITVAYLRALEEKRRTGHFPKVLISGNDPFGKSFVGRLEGKGFRIYSFGPDGKDDGGLTPTERSITGSKEIDVAAVYPPVTRKRSTKSSRTPIQHP